MPKAWAKASTVPLVMPLSKPKRKPPSAATADREMTWAEFSAVASALVVMPAGSANAVGQVTHDSSFI